MQISQYLFFETLNPIYFFIYGPIFVIQKPKGRESKSLAFWVPDFLISFFSNFEKFLYGQKHAKKSDFRKKFMKKK